MLKKILLLATLIVGFNLFSISSVASTIDNGNQNPVSIETKESRNSMMPIGGGMNSSWTMRVDRAISWPNQYHGDVNYNGRKKASFNLDGTGHDGKSFYDLPKKVQKAVKNNKLYQRGLIQNNKWRTDHGAQMVENPY